MRKAFTALTLLLPLLLQQPLAAQTVQLQAGAGSSTLVRLALLDGRVTGGRASIGLTSVDGALGLALHLRNTTTFGPIGNVIVDLDAAALTAHGVAANVAARATAGPFALRLRGHLATADGIRQLREPDTNFPALPQVAGQTAWGVQLGLTYRLSRELLVLGDPSVLAIGGQPALQLPLELQLPGLLADHDLRLLVSTQLPLGDSELPGWSAAGLGVRLDRGRAAAWDVWLLLGGNSGLMSPGFHLVLQDSLAGGQLRASFRLEPWRSDIAPLQLRLGWSGQVEGSQVDLFVEVFSSAGGGGHVLAGALYSWQLD